MSYQQVATCDVCGKQKEASNHWWIVFADSYVTLFPWSSEIAQNGNATHLCGEGCAAKLISKWMETTSKATEEVL